MPIDRFVCLAAGSAIMVALLFVTSHPIPTGWDKVAHFTVFATITALLWRGTNGRAPVAVLLAVIFFGAFDEVHQIFLPLRSAEFLDFVTDAAAAAAVCAVLFMRKKTLCVESSEP
ncbi:MAG: VanZ family protein [Betaproteobacteria bacterium]|nr:VanZ family protein [Betaproteobacteria bacterium]MBV9360864.1 VanZ family protein [Betaproteobacteria bacterium]